jgi:hypothetical protein
MDGRHAAYKKLPTSNEATARELVENNMTNQAVLRT